MSENPVVLGACGSPRARFKDTKQAVSIIRETESYQDLYSTIYELASKKKISNSEALMWMALFGAAKEGAEIDIILLKDVFRQRTGGPEDFPEDIKTKVDRAHGMVLASPVYFGDCSSLMNLFLENNLLQDKVVGVVSVGAKRNGGQETTNIFTLMEAMSQGAIIVGNGPPTSQYGGTGWAGDVGAILDDNFGLDTSLGTGKRVMEVIKRTKMKQASPAQITVITNPSSNDGSMIEGIKTELLKLNQVKTSFINLNEYNILPCNACSICPKPREQNIGYGCIIEDDMKIIDEEILRSDGLAFIIDDAHQNKDFWLKFKVFSERTRHLRRDNFSLSDVPVYFFCKKDIQRNHFLSIKAATYMLRQNTFICGPFFTRYYLGEKLLYETPPLTEACKKLSMHACKHKHAAEKNKLKDYAYLPIGYQINHADNKKD